MDPFDGMMGGNHNRRFCAVALALLTLQLSALRTGDTKAGNAVPHWEVNLQAGSGLRPFTTVITRPWTKQQNVVFLGPDKVAVYQVNQLPTPADLAKRDASGGAGNFFMDVRIFDAEDGHLIRALRLRTSGTSSEVLPTRLGNWIARTGDVMYLISPKFEHLAQRELPLDKVAPIERWETAVSPSGKDVVLVHQQMFSLPEPFLGKEGRAKAEVEILNADTLETVKAFSFPHSLSDWSVADGFLVSPNPNTPLRESEFGRLDFEGNWSPLKQERDGCQHQMDALRQQLIAVYGCGRLTLMSTAGERAFSRKLNGGEIVASVDGGEAFFAVEFARPAMIELPDTRIPIPFAKPVRIEAYDLRSEAPALSIPIRSDNVYYAISPQGSLAVVEGPVLKLYKLRP
jgi:hypothetical protein